MKALFDLSFTKFISPSIVRIVYILIMVLLGIDYLAWIVLGFDVNAGLGIFVLLIIGPIFTLVALAYSRMGLEVLIAVIRTAENTAALAHLNGGGLPPVPGPSTAPAAPYGPSSAYSPPPQTLPSPQAS